MNASLYLGACTENPKEPEWLKEILGEEAVDRCPNCGAENSMFKRGEFEQLNWLQLLLFSLLGLSLVGTVKKRSLA